MVSLFRRLWDTAREVPDIEDQQTPWKMIKLLKIISMCVVAVFVFGTALCSKVRLHLLFIVLYIHEFAFVIY